uniref:Uncharacterized protein n=1 Tax=Sphaerodactylus townsendi TaxID=933632 RepID=A0ACB8FZ82_9SAUR
MAAREICMMENLSLPDGLKNERGKSGLGIFTSGTPTSFHCIMAWELLFLAFLAYCSCVTSLPSWIQPASESVPLGQTAKLSCTVSGKQYEITWHQQRPGQKPRYVHYPSGSRGEGIPDRFTASVSGNVGYLTIVNVQAEDEADYYCGMWYDSSNWKYHRGEV